MAPPIPVESLAESVSKDENIDVRVWRGDALGGQLRPYRVPLRPSQTILDVVSHIQREIDPTLSYRFACRVGMCGSCAMTVNGKPRWTCRTHVAKVLQGGAITIEPLRNLPVIKDLACDLQDFFDKWRRAGGQFQGEKRRTDRVAVVSPSAPKRREANAGIECINCAVCFSACDTVESNPNYLGPAALNRAWTLINDERDASQVARLKAVSGDGGCQNCHSQQSCTAHCPNSLDPARSIAGLKRTVTKAVIRGEI